MAKKKSQVVYSPIVDIKTPLPEVSQKINTIPPYEDSGVKYQGKFKVLKGNNEYDLYGQLTRFYAIELHGDTGETFDFNYARQRANLKFFCTKLIVQWKSTLDESGYIELANYKDGQYDTKFYYWRFLQGAGNTIIDFSDCPRLFDGTHFGIRLWSNLSVGQKIVFNMYGWEE